MKKNRMMRLASGLLVAVLITTSTISGTFAKYVTSDDASDKARVAKFGVVVEADGSLFSKEYATNGTVTGDTDSISVKHTADNLVAPGTDNGANKITFSVSGAPEVDVKVEFEFDVLGDADNDVFLKAKTGLPDMTTGDNDTFDLANDYYPVVYTLKQTKKDGTVVTTVGNLATIKNALTTLFTANAYYNTDGGAGKDLADNLGSFEITWAWAFAGDQSLNGSAFTAEVVDQADTLLGDLAAGTTLVPDVTLTAGTDYNLKTGLGFTITVTQVD